MRIAWLAGALLGGCGGDKPAASDAGCADPDQWQTLLDDADEDPDDVGASFFSVNGPAWNDLYFAGGTLGVEPLRGLGLHFDGETWTTLELGVPQTMWWVFVSPQGTAWFAGEEGTVVEWRDGEPTVHDTPADGVLFGIWGTSDQDLWAVGGDVGEDEALIQHWDGAVWELVAPPDGVTGQLFKVWGPTADDVFIVGYRGTILHWDGSAWTQMESPATQQLFTVHGRSHDDVWAVGQGPTLVHFDGTSWSDYEDPTGEPIFAGTLNGVFAPQGGDVCVVGGGGVKVWIPDDLVHVEDTLEGGGSDFHGVWCDAEGNAFTAGGNFMSGAATTRRGAIDHHGCEVSTEGLPLYTPPG